MASHVTALTFLRLLPCDKLKDLLLWTRVLGGRCGFNVAHPGQHTLRRSRKWTTMQHLTLIPEQKKKVVQSNLQKWPFCAAAASRLCIFWSNIIKLMLFVGSIRVEWSLSVLTFSWTQTSKCKYMLQSCLIWLLSLCFLVRLLAWWVGSSLPVLSITSCCTRDNLLRCKSAARLSGLCLLLGFTAKPVCCPKLRD